MGICERRQQGRLGGPWPLGRHCVQVHWPPASWAPEPAHPLPSLPSPADCWHRAFVLHFPAPPWPPQLARAVPARRSPTAIYWHTSDLRFLVGRCPSGLYPSGGTTAHPVKCPSTTRSRAGSSARSTSCSLPTVLKSFLSTSYPPLAVVGGLERGLVSLLSGTRR